MACRLSDRKRPYSLEILPTPKSSDSKSPQLTNMNPQDFLFAWSTPATSRASQEPPAVEPRTFFSQKDAKVLQLFRDYLNTREEELLDSKIKTLMQANHEVDSPDSPPSQPPASLFPILPESKEDLELKMQVITQKALSLQEISFNAPTSIQENLQNVISLAASIKDPKIKENLLQQLTINYLDHEQKVEAIQILKYCSVSFQITTLNKVGKSFLEKGDEKKGNALIKLAHQLIDNTISSMK